MSMTQQRPKHAPEDPAISPQNILSKIFGYDDFRTGQKDIIDSVIAGESCCVLMSTGSGKSLCYQIPALCRDGVGIVVSPLIALMHDQVTALRELGVRAAAIHSGLDHDALQGAFHDLKSGALDMVYVAPERLVKHDFLSILDTCKIALLAIDEAHCISQWGHDFRPEYRQISTVRERYPDVPCIAVTATADAQTHPDIMAGLNLKTLHSGGFDRSNITYNVAVKNNPRAQVLKFLKSRAHDESGIVYCTSRKKVEDTAQWLCDQGYTALPYHAGLNKDTRARNQERFIKDENIIVVATIAFGMGINKPDVRFVAHMGLPKNIEAYYQETGRAGRDGLPAATLMTYGMQDAAWQRQMIESGDSAPEQKRMQHHKLGALLGYCETTMCRRQVLLKYFDDTCAPCGNCDTCLSPPKTINATVAAQKLLSCIYRTDQRFGAGYVIDVLLGKDTERINKFGHKAVSTYGIGTEHTAKEWKSIVRQLAASDFIHVDMENYGSLKITNKGRDFLKSKDKIELRVDPKTAKNSSKGSKSASSQTAETMLDNDEDRALFDALKALRMSIAKDKNIPPYVVFHDKTLIDMAQKRPATVNDLSIIHGVGQSKLNKYGALFLETINT